MMQPVDDGFYDRADEHIHLSNDQITDEVGSGKVSTSMLYAAARFNAWISACGFESGDQMKGSKSQIIDYFVEQYRMMLEENLDDYIGNFDKYIDIAGKS